MTDTATQCQKIIAFLKKRREATTMDLIRYCKTTSPHKRMSEIRKRGTKIDKRWKTVGRGKIRAYWLVGRA